MGQFKPMVKMETTEPTVELKLKKGGKVEKKMQMGGLGGMPAPGAPISAVGARGGMPPASAPMPPSLAARRRAMRGMPAVPAMAGPVGSAARTMGMKEGGKSDVAQDKAMIKKAIKQHDAQEHKGGKGTKLSLKSGGVTLGQGGYKDGGVISSKAGETKVVTAKEDSSPANTGGVKLGNAGGYATGGVAKANGGGYRKGGAAKKFAEGGRVQHDGGPEQMPQGRKKPSLPVAINELSGTFKKGGAVMMAGGGDPNAQFYKDMEAENKADTKAVKDALLYVPRKIRDAGKAAANLFKGQGSVTDTEREVSRTIVPAKKRGGKVC